MKLITAKLISRWFPAHVMFLTMLFFAASMAACGGGGSNGGATGANYTGSLEPALITAENSGALMEESFQGALTSDSMVIFAGASADTVREGYPSAPSLPLALQSAFESSLTEALGTSRSASSPMRGPMASSTQTMNDGQGGSATFTMNYNENTGAFSGTCSYNGYTQGGVTLSGTAGFAGRIDPETSAFDYFDFTFTNFTTTVEGRSMSISGTIDCDLQGDTLLITTDMVVTDSEMGLVGWINDYTIQVTGTQMWISGRYYDQVHGYVDFDTVEALTVYPGSDYPSAGLVVFTGAPGVGGQPTTARLQAISASMCQVTADFDGDGTLEYDSGEIPWTEL